MKVYVSQGHEKGIGIEVFLKSCLMMSSSELENITFLAYPNSVKQTLSALKIPHQIHSDSLSFAHVCLTVVWLDHKKVSESFSSLELGMKLAESGGVLFTLPTSKDQFPGFPGHTEFFRSFYKRPDLGMFFSSASLQTLLVTDHVSIKELPTLITKDFVMKRIQASLNVLTKWHWPIKKILISGLNPHAGEGGMIGKEDDQIRLAIEDLSKTFAVSGPFPGDIMLLEKRSPQDLLIYMFHDQALGVFKGQQGFIGSNITLGLPFPRFSPDHGTSFSLYGKNLADYRGCLFSLRQSLEILKKVSHGQNSSHQSQST